MTDDELTQLWRDTRTWLLVREPFFGFLLLKLRSTRRLTLLVVGRRHEQLRRHWRSRPADSGGDGDGRSRPERARERAEAGARRKGGGIVDGIVARRRHRFRIGRRRTTPSERHGTRRAASSWREHCDSRAEAQVARRRHRCCG